MSEGAQACVGASAPARPHCSALHGHTSKCGGCCSSVLIRTESRLIPIAADLFPPGHHGPYSCAAETICSCANSPTRDDTQGPYHDAMIFFIFFCKAVVCAESHVISLMLGTGDRICWQSKLIRNASSGHFSLFGWSCAYSGSPNHASRKKRHS